MVLPKEKRNHTQVSVLGNSLLKGTWGWLHSALRNHKFSSAVHGYRSLVTCAGSRLSSLTTSTTQKPNQSLSSENSHNQRLPEMQKAALLRRKDGNNVQPCLETKTWKKFRPKQTLIIQKDHCYNECLRFILLISLVQHGTYS